MFGELTPRTRRHASQLLWDADALAAVVKAVGARACVLQVEESGSLFLVNPRRLQARLLCSDAEPVFVYDASTSGDAGATRATASALLGAPAKATLLRACRRAMEMGRMAQPQCVAGLTAKPHELVAVAGWLLEYPVVYCVGAQSSNNLSGKPLRLISVRATSAPVHSVVRFSVPEVVWARRDVRVHVRSMLCSLRRHWGDGSEASDVGGLAIQEEVVTLDRVAL